MPTQLLSYISTTGWDDVPADIQSSRYGGRKYTDIGAWDAAFGGSSDGNLVANDEICIAELSSETWTAGYVLDGWVTDAANYLIIRAAPGAEYKHWNDTGAKLAEAANYGLDIHEWVLFENISIGVNTYHSPVYHRTGSSSKYYKCTIHSSKLQDPAVNPPIYDSCYLIFLGQVYASGGQITGTASAAKLRNSTIITNTSYGAAFRGDAVLDNVLVYNIQTSILYNIVYGFNIVTNYAQSDSNLNAQHVNATLSNIYYDVTKTDFKDFDNGDYRLADNSEMKGRGVPIDNGYNEDIEGNVYDIRQWPLGAYNVYRHVEQPASIPNPRLFMPELLIPGRKPVGSVKIDWTHPLTKGLELFTPLLPGRPVINLATGEDPLAITATMGRKANGNLWTNVSDRDFAAFALSNVTCDELTVMSKIIWQNATFWDDYWSLYVPGNSAAYWVLENPDVNSYGPSAFSSFTGIENISSIGTFYPLGTHSYRVSKVQNEAKLLMNGVPHAGGVVTHNPSYIFDVTEFRLLNRVNSNKRGAIAEIEFAAVWNRSLSDGEEYSFRINPYQFLIPA